MRADLSCQCTLTSEATKILLDDRFVDSRTTPDTLTVVMSNAANECQSCNAMVDNEPRYARTPPISLALDITQNNVLNRCWHTRHFPRNYERALSMHIYGIENFNALFAFQHRQASDRCCNMVFDLFCLMDSGIMSKISCMTAARNSRS